MDREGDRESDVPDNAGGVDHTFPAVDGSDVFRRDATRGGFVSLSRLLRSTRQTSDAKYYLCPSSYVRASLVNSKKHSR